MTSFLCISDIHCLEDLIYLEESDFLLVAGDFSNYGTSPEVFHFLSSLKKYEEGYFKHIIIVAGNHELCMESNNKYFRNHIDKLGFIYLEDTSVTIDGIKIHGSPWQEPYRSWAFNLEVDKRSKKWDLIDNDVDILITHSPPFGHLDKVGDSKPPLGCESLAKKVLEIKPKVHVFGHIHESAGMKETKDTIFINAGVKSSSRRGLTINMPIKFILNSDKKVVDVYRTNDIDEE